MSANVSALSPSHSTSYVLMLCDAVQTAPYLRGNLCSSICGKKSSSLKPRVDEGTSDSPTCSRGNISRSNSTQRIPAFARNAAIDDPPGPPPIMPTSKSRCDIFPPVKPGGDNGTI